MSETNQSLVKVYKNEDGNTVVIYGSADSCDIQSLDLESIVIRADDVDDIADALLSLKLSEDSSDG